MKKSFIIAAAISLIISISGASPLYAGDFEKISLPNPKLDESKSLAQALRERQSLRNFTDKELSEQMLSNLLWSAFGVNRADSGKRTAPTAVNWQQIDIYVALKKGLYIYDAVANKLEPVLNEDIREFTGQQRFTENAPVNLIYVADRARMGKASDEQKDFYSATDTGFISQNVYLFCASEGLSTVVLGLVDKPALAKKMGLRAEQRVILTQPVGFPSE